MLVVDKWFGSINGLVAPSSSALASSLTPLLLALLAKRALRTASLVVLRPIGSPFPLGFNPCFQYEQPSPSSKLLRTLREHRRRLSRST